MATQTPKADRQRERARTKEDFRRAAWAELSERFDQWMKMSNEELLKEVQELMPSVIEADRDGCLKFLTMQYADKIVDAGPRKI
jgi:hypothetical protein